MPTRLALVTVSIGTLLLVQRGTVEAQPSKTPLPNGKWTCAAGATSMARIFYAMTVTNGSYQLTGAGGSWTGRYEAGTNETRYGGVPVAFPTGGWHGFVGEYLAKGSPDLNRIPTVEHRLWLRPQDASSYSVTCTLP